MGAPRSAGSFWPVSVAVHAGLIAVLASGAPEPVPIPSEAPPVPLELRAARLSPVSDPPAFEPVPPAAPPADAPVEAPEATDFRRDPAPLVDTDAPPPLPVRPSARVPALDRPRAVLARRPAPEPAPPSPDESRVEPPSPSSNPPPEYPRAARHRGQEGLVVVSVRVSPEGRVIDASVAGSSGYPLLDEAALDALRRWTFVPGVRGGRAAAWTVEIPVRFRLASATARP